MIGIGIDTGGTCTDAVIIESKTKKVLSYGKTLTTKRDLKEGILKALKSLDQELVKQADYLSLSTTLATNACVEGKGGRAKLVFIGVKRNVVEKMAGTYGLPPADEIYFMQGDPWGKDLPENRPDWDKFREDIRKNFVEFDSVAIVQINPKYNDAAYEKQAKAIIKEELGLPCVCGYDLYQELNVQKRGATALLNARLLPVMESFFDSIDRSLMEMGLDLPIQVVKSDGNIMSREYALERPVETLLCGPAASIIGAMELSDEKDALIVDMGGTTSDVALVKTGIPVTSEGGISIGEWKTMVKGVAIDTFALGGDSGVDYEDNQIFLRKERIVPLCMLASQYPEVTDKLADLASGYAVYSYPANQFFLLANEPENLEKYTLNEQKLIKALQNGPLMYAEAAEAVGVSPYVFKSRRLEAEGVIIRSGVTPTDVMHIYGDYNAFDQDASVYGVEYISSVTKKTAEEVCRAIYDMAKERLYSQLVRILMKHETGAELSAADEEALEHLTSYLFHHGDGGYKFVQPKFDGRVSLVGIGAPTKIFLADVAAMLNVKMESPEYALVANAIGAAVGSIVSEYIVRIERCRPGSTGNFMVTGGETVKTFEHYADAIEHAKEVAVARAVERAREQGARGELETSTKVHEDFYDMSSDRNRLFLGAQVLGRAEAK